MPAKGLERRPEKLIAQGRTHGPFAWKVRGPGSALANDRSVHQGRARLASGQMQDPRSMRFAA